jgi:glycosyltransferase involved in cell wall biosynthesis
VAASRPRALVYGDVDLNLIDGSAIWVQGVTQALVAAGCEVTLVLKAPVRTDRLVAPLRGLDGVTIRSPHAEQLLEGLADANLTVAQAVAVLKSVDSGPHDLVVLRGRGLVAAAAKDGAFDDRLWAYLTDVPQAVPAMTPKHAEDLAAIAKSSRYLLCQTEELRCFLEGSVPAACGKSVLFPPVLPAENIHRDPERTPASGGAPLKLVYTGKFAPRWNTLEMTELPALLASRGVPAEVHMVGDKVHDDPKDASYKRRMRAALGEIGSPATGGVMWHGGKPRAEAMALAAAGDIGLSWRHPDLDSSLELSTKVLEFGQLGLPVILNRTPMHEQLLGADYPLFAASIDDVADAAASALDPGVFSLAASRTSAAAAEYTLGKAAARLRAYLSNTVATEVPARASAKPLRVVIAGHDLQFLARIIQFFKLQPGLDVRIDQWKALGEHDEAVSRELAEWADVVICEWCGPNAIWYSRHKRRDARLLVHLHRFELYSHYPGQVKIGDVDQVICVSDHYARLTREHTGWPASKVVTVTNPIDVSQLDRSKLSGAEHHLGMIGIAPPSRKRLDLALDVLEELRRDDDRYMLYVKSRMPWELWWVWQNPAERDHHTSALRRVQRSPLLQGAVVFDEHGPDVPAWLRRVGFMLSTSEDESFHSAIAEGMGSHAVPVIRHWEGAEVIYDKRWIRETTAEMAGLVASLSDPSAWREAGQAAYEQVQAFELGRVARIWHSLLTENLTPGALDPF